MQVLFRVRAIACAGALAALIVAAKGPSVRAQAGEALTGVVTSQAEGKMEGVLVTARRELGNFDVTVVSDAQGIYTFPRTHLQPGKYTLKIRAIGYDLPDPGLVELTAGKTATLDLKLQKTADLSKQLTSVEWLMSVPGTDAQKAMVVRQMEACTYCHTLEPVIKSKHTAEQFPLLMARMQKYYPDGSSWGFHEGRGRRVVDFPPEVKHAEESPDWGYWPGVKRTELAKYLASINMSGGKSLPKDLKTLPRPKGKATRVIITQYDMPRKETQPHDSDLDSKGRLWYTDQSAPFFGMFDPETATFTEYPLPVAKTAPVTGGSDVQIDKDDNPWFAKNVDGSPNHFGLLHKFDVKTKQLIPAKIPLEAFYQFLAMAPGPNSDGKIWAGIGEFYRVDPKTMEMDWRYAWTKSPDLPPGVHGYGYELAVDPEGNPWLCDYSGDGLAKVDVKTKKVTFYKTPTEDSSPRRGAFDAQGRFWFGQFTGDKIGMFDTKTQKFTEYDSGIKWFGTYTSSNPDTHGRVYGPSTSSDRIMRADSKTGEVVVYLMPTMDFDAKQMRIDPISGTALLFTNTHAARVMKLEPLD